MSTLDRLREALAVNPRTTTVVECRHCGTSAPPETDACPECGSGEIAHYEL